MCQHRFYASAGLLLCVAVLCVCGPAGANIYEWEYINPADPSQGRQASSVLLTAKDAAPGAILRDTNLHKAYLAGADLSGADFGELYIDFGLIIPAANLIEADFSGADLTDASFNSCPLAGAFFTDALITGTNFSDTALTYQQLTSTASFQAGNLTGIGLTLNNMVGWDLSTLDISNSYLVSSTLTGANLSNTILTSAYLNSADLTGANLSGSNLTDTSLIGSDLTNADFSGANLSGASLDYGDLTGADLTGSIITNVRFIQVKSFTSAQLISTASYQLGDLSGVRINGTVNGAPRDFSGLDFSGKNLSGALIWANLDGADMSGANLADANLVSSSVIGADFTDALIKGGDFQTLSTQQLASTASFKAGDISGTTFTGSDLSGLDMSGFDLSSIFAHSVDLTDSDLSGADLTGAYLYLATLSGVDLTDATINGAVFSRAIGLTEQLITSTSSYKAADLSGIDLSKSDLSGWNLSDLNMTGAVLGTLGSLGTSDLTNTDLSRSNLSEADLIKAHLTNTNFTDAIITGVDFRAAVNLTESQVHSTASYKSGNLSGISFQEVDLSGWDLSGLNLSGVDFEETVLAGTNLSGTNLTYAHFRSTNLGNADLSGAGMAHAYINSYQLILNGANLRGADMRGATTLSSSVLNTAADIQNLIHSNGWMVGGLILQSNELMRIRDYVDEDGITGLRISVQDYFDIDASSTLQMIFEDSDWGSTIRFDISVGTAYLGGALELSMQLDDGLAPAELLGATFQLFDWTGVSIVGGFDAVVVDPAWYAAGLSFDLSELLTSGEVQIVPLMGDLNGDAFVGIEDLNIVLAHWNQAVTPGNLLEGDLNGDGFVGIEDLNSILSTWNGGFPDFSTSSGAAIPEPSVGVLLIAGGICLLRRKREKIG